MGDRGIILIVTGVSGSGKTTVAMNLAQQLGWAFKSPIALSRETSDITFYASARLWQGRGIRRRSIPALIPILTLDDPRLPNRGGR